ncbi:MAG: diaminopimelate epimerase, partial [Legionellales bacterium]|nr:diaminopimelate epimerase [Legionellales bacterium]
AALRSRLHSVPGYVKIQIIGLFMKIAFTKMQGLGNDFIVINNLDLAIHLNSSQYRSLADRHYGIGCDQILLLEPSEHPHADYYYRIINADGREAEQCGNGARCMAKYIHDYLQPNNTKFCLATTKGLIELEYVDSQSIKVNLGKPIFTPAAIPFITESEHDSYQVSINQMTLPMSVLSMGNPHAVIINHDEANLMLEKLGQALNQHPQFPQGVNLSAARIVNEKNIQLRVYERGSGLTLACGSGACATMVAAKKLGLCNSEVIVQQAGGDLTVIWEGGEAPVFMLGEAVTVFEGIITLPDNC